MSTCGCGVCPFVVVCQSQFAVRIECIANNIEVGRGAEDARVGGVCLKYGRCQLLAVGAWHLALFMRPIQSKKYKNKNSAWKHSAGDKQKQHTTKN